MFNAILPIGSRLYLNPLYLPTKKAIYDFPRQHDLTNQQKGIFIVLAITVLIGCSQTDLMVEPTIDSQVDEKFGEFAMITGDAANVETTTQSGFVLMGGSTDVDEAIAWMIERSGGGDFVVIRATGTDAYNNYIYGLGTVNSVETIIINSVSKANKTNIENKIKNAEALFIAGGDQYDYVKYWKNTKVENAINYLINTKKVPVGGTSAGCAILGDVYFSAQFGTVTSSQALNNPYSQKVALGKNDFVNIPILAQTITDTHFDNPDRRGRATTFLARMVQDWNYNAKGIAVEEKLLSASMKIISLPFMATITVQPSLCNPTDRGLKYALQILNSPGTGITRQSKCTRSKMK